MVRDNIAVLTEDWNELERCSDSWCQEQVRLITDQLLEQTDIEGIRALLSEMSHKNLDETVSYAARMLEHLFKLKYCNQSDAVSHWRREISEYRRQLISLFDNGKNRDLLTTYRKDLCDRMWKQSIKLYKADALDYIELQSGIQKIPKENPYQPEDLLELALKELLEKLN